MPHDAGARLRGSLASSYVGQLGVRGKLPLQGVLASETVWRIVVLTITWLSVVRDRWVELRVRYPWLHWVETWGISISSLVLGFLTLLVFRRGIEYFPWFVGYLLLFWLAGVALAEVRQSLASRGRRLIALVVDYTVQTLFHGLLLFLLPIYYASTTLTSGNVWFLVALAGAALITAIDPWYRAIVLRFRWIEVLLFGFGLFASLNVALPLIRVPSAWTLLLSGLVSILALAPILHRGPDASWSVAIVRAGLWGVAFALFLWLLRGWIPPVPLHLTRATFAKSVVRLEPVQPVSTLSRDELRAWGGVAAFCAVTAPAGLREPIYHLWRRDGTVVETIPLSPVRGGLRAGFRTYSRKTDLGQELAGSWTVDVLTAQDQLIGRIQLEVTR